MKYIKSPRKTTERKKYQFRDQEYPDNWGRGWGLGMKASRKVGENPAECGMSRAGMCPGRLWPNVMES